MPPDSRPHIRVPASASSSETSARTLDGVESALRAAYSDVTVRLPPPQVRPELRLRTFSAPGFALGDLELTTAAVRSAHFPWFAVCLPAGGDVRVTTPRATTMVGGATTAIVNPGDPADVDYLSARCRMRTVLVEYSALHDELCAMLGAALTRPLRFEPEAVHVSGSPFDQALRLLAAEAVPGGLADVAAMSTRLARLVMAGLLTTHRHSHSEALESGGRPWEGPKSIREAVEVLESRPADIATVGDLARIVGLSVRALDAGFQRHVGLSPMRYLRQVRLARVHADLVAADPHATTATAVARRWGFAHYGRFAAEYRRLHDCTPAQTLQSAR